MGSGSTAPAAIEFADFDGDSAFDAGSDTDLAISDSGSGNVRILLGQGNGTFCHAEGSPVSVGGSGPASVKAAQIDPGAFDFATANSRSNNASVLKNNTVEFPGKMGEEMPYG
ncbi:MAG: hypothetical protein ACRDH5_10270 [bacterium]